MKIDIKKFSRITIELLLVVVIVIIVLITRHRINNLKEELDQVTVAHNELSGQLDEYKNLITRQGDSLRMVKQIILDQKKAIELGILNERELRNKYLREVFNVTNLSEQIEILKKQGRYVDTVYIDTFNQEQWLKIPSTMLFEDKWYKLNVTADRIPLLNSLLTYSEPTITIGTIKKGILKKPEKVVIYENMNPYIKLTSAESITIKEQQKWYQTTWFKVGTGFIGGVVVTTLITK